MCVRSCEQTLVDWHISPIENLNSQVLYQIKSDQIILNGNLHNHNIYESCEV